MFNRYIGIDYSGAKVPTSSLKGLRVYMTENNSEPEEVPPPPGPRKYWSRRELALWLVERLEEGNPTIVGIDHAFSFPIRYFETYRILPEWDRFLDDFCTHWPTDDPDMYVDFVREGRYGDGISRQGKTRWKRITEERVKGPKSVFHFDVPGSVAKSSHAGIPWLRYIRQQVKGRVHFWPYDGWKVSEGSSVIAEIYPSLWSRDYPKDDRTPDQQDAYAVAAWLQDTDQSGKLAEYFEPELKPGEKPIAQVEGWILGVR